MRTVREISAGGVVYRFHRGQIEVALIRVRHRWGLPKGHVEEGEGVQEAALREVLEETGIEGKVIEKLGDITYWYTNKTRENEPIRIFKRVYFYLVRSVRADVRNHDHEVEEVRWFPIQEALRKVAFPTERKMLQKALSILSERARTKMPPHRRGVSRE
ncbi:MAG TPA: NUDIX hydrolase [Candidatus Binatia bacterium]|nr:NUDIX hydrolase [Candidatus Binatia bacterium]